MFSDNMTARIHVISRNGVHGKSVAVRQLPLWLIRSLESLIGTIPNVTGLRLTLLSEDHEMGQLNYDLRTTKKQTPQRRSQLKSLVNNYRRLVDLRRCSGVKYLLSGGNQ
jgi:hypothetical protein